MRGARCLALPRHISRLGLSLTLHNHVTSSRHLACLNVLLHFSALLYRRGSPRWIRTCLGACGPSSTTSAGSPCTTCCSPSSRKTTPGYASSSFRYVCLCANTSGDGPPKQHLRACSHPLEWSAETAAAAASCAAECEIAYGVRRVLAFRSGDAIPELLDA